MPPSQSFSSSLLQAEGAEDHRLRWTVEVVVDLLGAEAELIHLVEEVELQGPVEEGEVMTSFQANVVHSCLSRWPWCPS